MESVRAGAGPAVGVGWFRSLDGLRREEGGRPTLLCSKSRRVTLVRLACWEADVGRP